LFWIFKLRHYRQVGGIPWNVSSKEAALREIEWTCGPIATHLHIRSTPDASQAQHDAFHERRVELIRADCGQTMQRLEL
jgi:hypothetical protein